MENNPEHEKILQQIYDFAISHGYISTYDTCHVLAAENLKYDFQALIKRFGINTKLLPKHHYDYKKHRTSRWRDNDMIPEDCELFIYNPPSAPPFEKRRMYWYHIILRLISGIPGTWKDEFSYFPVSQGRGHMPIYRYISEIGRFKLISDTERIQGPVKFAYLKLEDVGVWFADYLKIPVPVKLIPIIKRDHSISKDDNLKWKDITITFINDSEIHVQFKATGVTRTYEMAGFMDKKSKKPINAWLVLKTASEEDGKIPFEQETRKKVEKIAQTIRKKFRELFPGIEDDPIPIDKKCYKPAFHLKTTIE